MKALIVGFLTVAVVALWVAGCVTMVDLNEAGVWERAFEMYDARQSALEAAERW